MRFAMSVVFGVGHFTDSDQIGDGGASSWVLRRLCMHRVARTMLVALMGGAALIQIPFVWGKRCGGRAGEMMAGPADASWLL